MNVPPAQAALDGRRVKITAWDRDEDDVLRGDSDVLVIVPGWFGHARRQREGDDVDA
jgi:hypothetical protein